MLDPDRNDRKAEAAFADIYHRHSAAVTAYALRRTGSEDAADAVAETFVVAWRRFEDIPDEPSVRPWLFGVARRVLANQRRGGRRRDELVRKASTYLAPRFAELPDIETTSDLRAIVAAMNTLPAKDRELLMLVAWEELTPSEVAVTLGVSGAVVRKRLFRARQRLAEARKRMEGEALNTGQH